jgi:hypothetical protein
MPGTPEQSQRPEMSSKKDKPKPSAKTLRDKRKAKNARRAKRKEKAWANGVKAPPPTYANYIRRPLMPAGMYLNNLIALGMLGLPRPPRRPATPPPAEPAPEDSP